jgi:hypothetical protein
MNKEKAHLFFPSKNRKGWPSFTILFPCHLSFVSVAAFASSHNSEIRAAAGIAFASRNPSPAHHDIIADHAVPPPFAAALSYDGRAGKHRVLCEKPIDK